MSAHVSQKIAAELAATAQAIASPGKGILAADESTGTIGKRFSGIHVENTEANRAAYRELLFTTKQFNQYISGVILYEETLFQKNPTTGLSMVKLLQREHVIPGIKVDLGVVALPGTDGENSTQGLDKLAERCDKYYEAGARFAKWRAVLNIDPVHKKPSELAIQETAHTLARYAAICQKHRLVPIVEPELLADGNHTIEDCAHATEKTLVAVFHALHLHHVLLEGCLLKPNMVTSGAECPKQASPEEVALFTVRTLRRTVPPALPGIHFLSGGQSEEAASLNLDAMNKQRTSHPWKLSFSYGRALQSSCLKVWGGKAENTQAAQNAFLARAKANGEAQLGKYKGNAAGETASKSLYEKNYVY